MTKIRALLATFITVCGLLFINTTGTAATIRESTLAASDTTVRKGQELMLVFSLDGYDNINTVKGTVSFDAEIFEEPTQDAFAPLNSWESVYYNAENGQFILIRRTGSTENEAILQIKLTAKENLPAKDTYVKIDELSASAGDEEFFPEQAEIKLSAIAQQTPAESTPPAEEQNQPESSSDVETKPQKNNDAVKTGDNFLELVIFCVSAGAAFLLIVILTVIRRKKGRIGGIRMLTGALIIAATASLAAGSIYAFEGKGDLNGDGSVDYTDVYMLQKHLIALETLDESKWNTADLNSDGKLTITDLSLLIQKIEKSLNYQVTITSAMDKFYYEKQEDVALKFYAKVSYGAEIESVTVNGTEYVAQRAEESAAYIVQLKAADTAGVQEFHITKAKLRSGQEVNIDYTEKIDVLKAAPSVENFLAEEITDSAQMKVSFLLKDEDSALTSSRMEVLLHTDGAFTAIDIKKVSAGKNTFLLDLETDTAYTIHIAAQYVRDTNTLEAEEDHSGSIAVMKEIQLNIDYQFSFGNMRLQTEDGTYAEKFSKNQPIVLWFESSNATKFKPERVTVNGEIYSVESSQNGYFVALGKFAQAGSAEIRVEQVILENGKVFSLHKDNVITVMILKAIPEVTELSAQENNTEGQVYITFRLTDPDRTLSNGKILVQNADGKTVGKQLFEIEHLQNGMYSDSIVLTDTGLTTSYTVQIIADCDLSADATEVEQQKILAEQNIKAQPRALVTAGASGNAYAEKGSDVELFYQISDNVEAEVSKLVINNMELTAVLGKDKTWKAVTKAKDVSGIQEFVLSQLVFADGTIVNVHHKIFVEIMKSAPTITDYETEDILEKGQVKFQFFLADPEHSFLSGKMQLILNDGAVLVSEKVFTQSGMQEFILDVEERQAYTFRILLSWKKTADGGIYIADDVALEKAVYVIRDYGLHLSEIRTYTESGTNTPYYEPDSTVHIRFRAETLTSLVAEQVQMNGTMFDLTSVAENIYEFSAKIDSGPGVQTLTMETLVLENGKKLSVESENSVQVEILKAVPVVKDFTSEKTDQDTLKVQFVLEDTDGALEGAQVQIAEASGKILLTKPISAGKQEVSVKLTEQENYTVTIYSDYDRDTNALDEQSNFYKNEELYTTVVTMSRDVIQFKDITDTKLYQSLGNSVQRIDVLDITDGLPTDVKDYYAVIEMENLPDFYAGIKEFRQDADSGRVYAVIEQENVILYDSNGARQNEYAFPLTYRDKEGEHPLIKSAEELFRQMSANPSGSFTLTEDLDASEISADIAVPGVFTGELNGNGHKILHLPTSLFDTLSGAHIHNLVIEGAQVTTSRSGILANVIQNRSVIENVFIVDSSISNEVDGLGAFAGTLHNATIRESASINVSIKGLVAVGGIVGKTNAGAIIENCFVTGKIQGTYDHPTLGARVGGITGWHGGGEIRYSFTQVQVMAPAKKGNGGIIGGPNTGSPVIENCLSLSTGAGYRIAGFDVLTNVKNVYEYSGSGSATNITDANKGQIKETDAIFDKSFYRDTLGLDETIWNLDLLSYGKRPNLKTAPEVDNNYEIPEYSLVQSHESYMPEREQAYANIAKLIPYADVRMWVEYGNKLPDSHILTVQAVQFILPLDKNGDLVTGVHRNTLSEVEKIRIVFEEGKPQEHAVSWKKAIGNTVAVYQIQGTDMMYQFHSYIANLEESLLKDIIKMVSAYEYAADIAVLTSEEESRLYTDYYNETLKPRISEIVTKLLLSQSDYPTYCESETVQRLIQERISDESTWKKLLYGYNYYDKWYHINYRDVILSDLLFFNGEQIAQDMTASSLSEKLLAAAPEQRATHRTVTFYTNVLQNHTEKPLMEFLGDLSYSVAGYDNPSDWFADNFDGILKEQKAQGGAEGIRYRIWDILSGIDDGRKSIILPILTAPQEDMYLISLPSQLMIGSMNRYNTYINKDGNERKRMQEIIDVYAEKMGVFYGVSSTWMHTSVSQLNSFVNIQYDTRLNFPESEAAAAGDQDKDKTRDPVMKWVYEANNTISAKNGSAASADGMHVFWMLDSALGTSDYTFFTFSHETAHNQDGKYFYGGAGRRNGTGGEAHADGNIAQEMRDGCMVFNISKINDIGVEMTNNFSYERIDSAGKIKSYYSEMFETGYVLDYLAAQAFLRLTTEQQAKVAVQATHIAGGTASLSTVYSDLSVEELEQMNLQNIEDLWENKISIRNIKKGSLEKVNTATDGSYGFESFYNMNWYQSHNDNGSPDTHSFKRLGMEMLGVGGYEGGYMIYMSALSENDLDALRKITGDSDITWKKYKLDRFDIVKKNLDRIPYFDAETVIEQFQTAFEKDAKNGTRSESIAVKRMLYGIVKRATGDFSDGGIYESPEAILVTSAEELIRLAHENAYGYYKLEADLDFTEIAATQGSYIPNRFIGILDGNGHKITGMQYPLFGDLQYAQVKDLTITELSFHSEAQAVLAVKARQTLAGNVTVENNNRQLPLVKTTTDVYHEYGNTASTAETQILYLKKR